MNRSSTAVALAAAAMMVVAAPAQAAPALNVEINKTGDSGVNQEFVNTLTGQLGNDAAQAAGEAVDIMGSKESKNAVKGAISSLPDSEVKSALLKDFDANWDKMSDAARMVLDTVIARAEAAENGDVDVAASSESNSMILNLIKMAENGDKDAQKALNSPGFKSSVSKVAKAENQALDDDVSSRSKDKNEDEDKGSSSSASSSSGSGSGGSGSSSSGTSDSSGSSSSDSGGSDSSAGRGSTSSGASGSSTSDDADSGSDSASNSGTSASGSASGGGGESSSGSAADSTGGSEGANSDTGDSATSGSEETDTNGGDNDQQDTASDSTDDASEDSTAEDNNITDVTYNEAEGTVTYKENGESKVVVAGKLTGIEDERFKALPQDQQDTLREQQAAEATEDLEKGVAETNKAIQEYNDAKNDEAKANAYQNINERIEADEETREKAYAWGAAPAQNRYKGAGGCSSERANSSGAGCTGEKVQQDLAKENGDTPPKPPSGEAPEDTPSDAGGASGGDADTGD